MKKVILLLSITGFLLTSCLGDSGRQGSGWAVVYIAQSSGIVYGRTHTGHMITSEGMQLMIPGTIQTFTYSWDEEAYGVTMIGDYPVDNVRISGDPVEIPINYLRTDPVPEDEDPDRFVQIGSPLYWDDKVSFGDNWLIEYAYESKKGEEAHLEFYVREEPDEGVDVTIDIRLVITGEPESESSSATAKADIAAIRMSPVRDIATPNSDKIKINFKYYVKGNSEEPNTSSTYQLTVSE